MEKKLTESQEYDIRYSELPDGDYIKKWLVDKDTSPWYPPEDDTDREMFVRNWIGFSKFKASLTAVHKNIPIGVATIYLMPYTKVAHISMVYFIVDPAFKHQGVGASLLQNIKNLAKNRFRLESMHCEVYAGCPAAPLLSKCGFKDIIRQENFVDIAQGPAARIIYECDL